MNTATGHLTSDAPPLETTNVPTPQRAAKPPGPDSSLQRILRQILSGSAIVSILAVLLALVVGAVLVAVVNPHVQATAGYFFSRPGDTFAAVGDAVVGAYAAMVQGGLINIQAPTFAQAIQPFLTSLGFATPLVLAGLGIAFAFRAGMFNIGGQGQILVSGALAGYVAFAWPLPPGIHLLVAVVAAVAGGALWAGIAGALKSLTGAHEVISTIMLNYVAYYLIGYLLSVPVLRDPDSNSPTSPAALPTAVLPQLGGGMNIGFLIAVAATLIAWWTLGRSGLGFRIRAVGENPDASKVAGISVKATYIVAMLISGAFIGLAGSYQTLGQITSGFTSTFDAGIGFTAITVALLGRSRPFGVLGAGILFGVFQAGGYTMQAAENIDVDLVAVIQALIVLFIAAPPLVRAIFRLPDPARAPHRSPRKEAVK